MPEVDDLRSQLRTRGYLTHSIERWFALDPWSSRAFWLELVFVALKAGTLIAAFAALPMTAVMLFRNSPLTAFETLALFLTYAAAWLVFSFVLVILIALVLKLRPALPIETPRALLGISLGASALLVLPIAIWWYRFDTGPATAELLAGIALTAIFFLIATVVISAALLSFSIYEVHRVPAIHQKPRTIPMTVAAAVLIALLFIPAYAAREREASGGAPMVVISQTSSRVALVAVDGLTNEILQSRPDLANLLYSTPLPTIAGASTTERWASLGTGVPTSAHGVRAIEGVRFRGGRHILQRVSRSEVVLMNVAPLLRIARRDPLPPTVRRRDYVWELAAERGIPSLSVNWWTTADERHGALTSIAQEEIFNRSKGDPLKLDELAASRFLTELERRYPRFATVYLPALDVILNRARLDQTTQLARSIRVLDNLTNVIRQLRVRGFDVLLIGLPGDHQLGQAVLASNLRLAMPPSTWDVAPTILTLLGFPLSREMPGHSLRAATQEPRIPSYGRRNAAHDGQTVNEEYYENLRSLGYIR